MSKYTHLVSDDIREAIEDYIDKNNLKPGDTLPPERKLCEMLNCNRSSLRRAITHMAGEDILFTTQGIGTYIAPAKFLEDASKFISFSSSWQDSGHRVRSKLLTFSETDANLKTSQILGIPLGTRVYQLKRLRLVDEVPLMIEISYIEKARCPGLLSVNFDGSTSLYRVLSERYHINITHQQQNIRTSKARGDEADILCVEEGSAVFYVVAVGMTEDSTVIEHSIAITRADRFAITYKARKQELPPSR